MPPSLRAATPYGALVLCACVLGLAPAGAAPPRTTRVEVTDPAGRPLPDLPVLVACDEKDVLARTDQHGRLEVSTRSAEVTVLAPPVGGVRQRGPAGHIRVTIDPATLARAASGSAARAGVSRAGSGRGLDPSLFWAGSNDAPNSLVRGSLQGTALTFLPEVASGGSASGGVSTEPYGLRVGPQRCGIVGRGDGSVQALRVEASGALTATNVASPGLTAAGRFAAVSPDGTFAALGYGAALVALFGLDAGTCQASFLGLGFTFLTGSAAYVAFDQQNRLFVAEANANSVRVFQASASGLTELAVAPTGHPLPTGPVGIDAALQSSVPVELQRLVIE